MISLPALVRLALRLYRAVRPLLVLLKIIVPHWPCCEQILSS